MHARMGKSFKTIQRSVGGACLYMPALEPHSVRQGFATPLRARFGHNGAPALPPIGRQR